MVIDPVYEKIWSRFGDFTFGQKHTEEPPGKQPIPPCEYAQAYTLFAQEVCQAALHHATHATLNQALIQVTKKYWEYFYVVPKRHRYQVGERGHRCIHAVFQQFSELLKCKELQLAPPMLFIPQPSAPPPRPELPLIPPPPEFSDEFIVEPQ